MKRRSVSGLVLVGIIIGSLFSNPAVQAATSLQNQVKALQSEVAALKKTIAAKDKQISTMKNYTVSPLKTKVAFQGNVKSGYMQAGRMSVPVLLNYKGIRYAPVDLLGNLLNTTYGYDKNSDTVFYGPTSKGLYLSDVASPYYSSYGHEVNADMTMGGQEYNKGYSMTYWGDTSKYAINLDAKYNRLTGLVGLDDSSEYNNDFTFEIYGDNKLLGSYDFEDAGLPVKVDIDVTSVRKIELYAKGSHNNKVDFANVRVK